jgi:HD-GYP domain-containing protein (c-di-GMP phosphodiesterase class II)
MKTQTTKDHPQIEEKLILKKGEELIQQFFASIKTAQIYEPNNTLFIKQSQKLSQTVFGLLESCGQISLKIRAGYVFLNDLRLRFDFDGYAGSKFILEYLQRLDIQNIFIEQGVSSKDLDEFVYLFAHTETEEEGVFDLFEKKLNLAGIAHIKIGKFLPAEKESYLKSLEENKRIAKKAFFKSVSVVREAMSSLGSQKTVNIVRVKRTVQSLVDLILQDETTFLELTAIKNFDEYTFLHSANVCVLSIMMGVRLGLDRKKLGELGFAALFHDVGKVRLPYELINKPTEFDDSDWQQVRQHPIMGVKSLLSFRKLDDYSMRAMVVSFEHHLNLDCSGYPEVKNKSELNLFSRIVSIADAYDAMTSGRVYVKKPYSPDEALKRMLYRQGIFYDPIMMKVFINVMGVYPVGTLVVLNTGEIGLVYRTNPEDLARPLVKIIADRSGEKEKVQTVDLRKFDEATGEYILSIAQTLDPEKCKIDISRHLSFGDTY